MVGVEDLGQEGLGSHLGSVIPSCVPGNKLFKHFELGSPHLEM